MYLIAWLDSLDHELHIVRHTAEKRDMSEIASIAELLRTIAIHGLAS